MPQDKKKKFELDAQAESLAFEFADEYGDLIDKHSENALAGMTDNYSTRFAGGPSGYNDFIRIALSKLPKDRRDKVKNLDDLLHLEGTKFTEEAWRDIYAQTEGLQDIETDELGLLDKVGKYKKTTKEERIDNFYETFNEPRSSGSETESGAKVAVGDIQPVGYSEVGPNAGPSGTSDAPSFKESLDYNDEHYGKSSAQRQWELRKLKKLYPDYTISMRGRQGMEIVFSSKNEGTSINDDPNTLQNMRVELDNIAKVDRKTAFNAAKAWMQSGFIAIGHDLKLKFNQFDQEEE